MFDYHLIRNGKSPVNGSVHWEITYKWLIFQQAMFNYHKVIQKYTPDPSPSPTRRNEIRSLTAARATAERAGFYLDTVDSCQIRITS